PLADEVMDQHHGRGLAVPVDTAVPLLHPRRREGSLDVDEPIAVKLEVDAFTRGVGSEQNAHGALRWMRLELRLDALPALAVHAAVEHLDPVLHLALGQV